MFNIIRLFVLFLLIYFLYNLFKTTMIVRRDMRKLREQARPENRRGKHKSAKEDVIELNHDQYRVD